MGCFADKFQLALCDECDGQGAEGSYKLFMFMLQSAISTGMNSMVY